MLVLEPNPERRRALACFVRGAGVDVFELGELAALCWYLERSRRWPELLVIGVPLADEAEACRVMNSNPGLPILFVAPTASGRAPSGPAAHPILVVDSAREGEALGRRVLATVRAAAATRQAHKSA